MTRRNFLQGLLAAPLLALLPRRAPAARLEALAAEREAFPPIIVEPEQKPLAFGDLQTLLDKMRRDLADELSIPRHALIGNPVQDTRAYQLCTQENGVFKPGVVFRA